MGNLENKYLISLMILYYLNIHRDSDKFVCEILTSLHFINKGL